MTVAGHTNFQTLVTNHGHISGRDVVIARKSKSIGSYLFNELFAAFVDKLKVPRLGEESRLLDSLFIKFFVTSQYRGQLLPPSRGTFSLSTKATNSSLER